MKRLVLLLGSVLLLVPTLAHGGIGEISGTLDLAHVDARIDDDRQDSLRQLYLFNFYRAVTQAIDFRAGVRYFKFDLESAEQFGSFQEEIQPNLELLWTHPWFRFTGAGSRRIARSNVISGELITDSVLLSMVSAWRDTPEFFLRYELQDIEETGAAATRNIVDQRVTGGVDYQRERETFNYQLTAQWNENLVGGVESREISQRFLYRGQHAFGERENWLLSSSYRYSRRDRVAEVATGGRFLELVGPTRGLGGIDVSPEVDPLPNVPGLIDGNTVAPVVPPLGIGSGQVDRNIGADLGVIRDRVGAVYVYVDRLSGAGVTWSLWVSDDNLNWTEPGATVTARFVPSLLRYEIEFEEVSTRFVKVVNGGLNQIPDVQVTEIQVLEALPITEGQEQDASSHLADARLVWDADHRWRYSAEAVALVDPPTGSVSQRTRLDYTLQARYRGENRFSHILRWSQSWQDLEGDERDTRDDNATYSLIYDPLPTLGASLSATGRQSTEGGEVSVRSANALLTGTATPWPDLRSTAEVGVNRIDDLLADFVTDAWQTRVSIDADITRRLRGNTTWYYQESFSGDNRDRRVLRRFNVGGELQVTSAVFARARVGWIREDRKLRSEEYLVSWRIFTRLLVTGQANIDDDSGGFRTERYSVGGNLDLFERFIFLRNVTGYVRFSDLDQSQAGGSRILSWQQGLRATF